jgi:protease I
MTRIAILAENFFEDLELLYPWYRLREEGFQVDLVGTAKGATYKGKHGYPVTSELASQEVKPEDYDGLIIPGGYSPDLMRRCKPTLDFVKAMDQQKKPIAAICHGPWMMASCCDLKGKRVTSHFSIQDDLRHAGGVWEDQAVVVDGNLVSSRTPADLIPFTVEFMKLVKAKKPA